ncbi:MAG: hypothetical protein RL693_1361 [Verrucomicrobiota bacterium]|jgi:hypothetical protein
MKLFNASWITTAWLSALVPFSLLSAAEGEEISPTLGQAEVRLPYAELKKLWDAAQPAIKPEDPPVPPSGVLLAARYNLDLLTGNVVMTAEFKVESFAGNWEKIPLMGAGLAVASVEPEDTRLILEKDFLCLMVKEIGPATIKVRFNELPLPASDTIPLLSLLAAPGAVGSLQVKGLLQERLLKIKDGQPLTRQEGGATLALPSKGGEVTLYLTDARLEKKVEPPPPPLPLRSSEWTLQNEVLAYEGDGELCYRIKSHAMALNGSAVEMTVLLPANARSIKLDAAEDLSDWKMERNSNGLSELRLRWTTRDIMERSFRLSYAMQKLPLENEWELKAPALADEDKTKSLFMFPLSAGVEVKADNLQGPVPLEKLSRWVAEEKIGMEFGTVSGGSSVKVQNRLLPRLETAVATITKSQYTTRLVSDGSTLTEAVLEVEHDDKIRWAFSLPDKCELLKCAVNEASIQPIDRGNGSLEIPLAHAGGKATRSQVTFSYTSATGKLDAVEGSAALELPQTPLFISELLWSVEVPPSYEVSAVEGNVELTAGTSASNPHAVSLIKKLYRNERPQAQLFYHKRGLE